MTESTAKTFRVKPAGEADPRAELQDVIDRLVANEKPITVLEAGCGSATHIRLSDQARIVGIDISEDQLAKNSYVSQKIVGDVQTHEFEEGGFDLIICWDVLEHLPHPEKALMSFARAVKTGGVILLALPNVYSLKGLITKFTPHWFHVWVYRNVYKNPNAGKPGHAPFPTFLRRSVSPRALRRFAAENKLAEEYFRLYESSMVTGLKNRSSMLYAVYRTVLVFLKLVSFGAYDGTMSDVFIILRKPAG